MSRPLLQVALDLLDGERAMEIAGRAAQGRDIIQVGTPLILLSLFSLSAAAMEPPGSRAAASHMVDTGEAVLGNVPTVKEERSPLSPCRPSGKSR